jgi:hypothetical protein
MTATLPTALTDTRQQDEYAAAAIVYALEGAWAAIRSRHPDVPAVVVIVGSGSERGQLAKWGHFAAHRWQAGPDRLPEVLVSGEGLNREPDQVLATLLHEATHGLAFARNVKDTSRQGRWHNKRFATLAAELGLTVDKTSKYGWSTTTCAPATALAYQDTLVSLKGALTLWRHTDVAPPITPKAPTSVAAFCECPRRIRVAIAALREGPIVCAVCDGPFLPDQPIDGQDQP